MKASRSHTLRHLGTLLGVAAVVLSGAASAQDKGPDEQDVDRLMKELTRKSHEQAEPHGDKPAKIAGCKCRGPQWPEKLEQAKLRFIRLEHDGPGWDDGMDQSGADANFLREFARVTGFQAAAKGESHSIALLDKYPADGFPPFVYLTGNGNMGRVSAQDIKILREYCLKGGMLIADAGSAQFHRSFSHFIRQVFPDKALVDIADDDTLYQIPHHFPNGAPAFWQHGGRRALGIKHEGRWVVFYHPGDMNDAWKKEEFTDVSDEMRQNALNLGVNLVFHAFQNWEEATTKDEPAEKAVPVIREIPDLE